MICGLSGINETITPKTASAMPKIRPIGLNDCVFMLGVFVDLRRPIAIRFREREHNQPSRLVY